MILLLCLTFMKVEQTFSGFPVFSNDMMWFAFPLKQERKCEANEITHSQMAIIDC